MKPAPSAYWREIASGRRRDAISLLVVAFLLPASLLYALIQYLRSLLYRTGILTTKKLPRPVISIGNIAVGGTGKTPVTAYIARFLTQQGVRAAVLSRGYGGSMEGQTAVVSDGESILLDAEQSGDEPYLLASQIPGLIVVIGTDRYVSGLMAMTLFSPDIFLLDDGFQHLRLHRDLDVLLLDYRHPFGNGWTLPAGLLREHRSATARADIVIHTRCPEDVPPSAPAPGKIVCNAMHRLVDARPYGEDVPVPFTALHGRKLLAFAGIAEPQSFFEGLGTHGLDIVATLCFPDHTAYTAFQIAEITSVLHRSGADGMITTEKDGVKLKQLPVSLREITLLARLDLTVNPPSPLEASLLNLLHK